MLTHLWNRHYHAGVTGSYHGDMARAFAHMLRDPELGQSDRRKLESAIHVHCSLERSPLHNGRKWFCERWGTAVEQHCLTLETINAM